jgi:hypothetical protein
MVIQVKDKRGWQKQFPIEDKILLFIGAGPHDDILLNSAPQEDALPVGPRQAQLLNLHERSLENKPMLQLINLSQVPIALQLAKASQPTEVESYVKADIVVGDAFCIGGYTLRLEDDEASPQKGANADASDYVSSQGDIGLSFELSNPVLAPHGAVQGRITVRNNGPRKAAQFQLSVWLDGAINAACQLSTASFALYPNASQEATVWVRHPCNATLTADEHVLEVRVEAPGAYPNQTQAATRPLRVLPCFDHEVRLRA